MIKQLSLAIALCTLVGVVQAQQSTPASSPAEIPHADLLAAAGMPAGTNEDITEVDADTSQFDEEIEAAKAVQDNTALVDGNATIDKD